MLTHSVTSQVLDVIYNYCNSRHAAVRSGLCQGGYFGPTNDTPEAVVFLRDAACFAATPTERLNNGF